MTWEIVVASPGKCSCHMATADLSQLLPQVRFVEIFCVKKTRMRRQVSNVSSQLWILVFPSPMKIHALCAWLFVGWIFQSCQVLPMLEWIDIRRVCLAQTQCSRSLVQVGGIGMDDIQGFYINRSERTIRKSKTLRKIHACWLRLSIIATWEMLPPLWELVGLTQVSKTPYLRMFGSGTKPQGCSDLGSAWMEHRSGMVEAFEWVFRVFEPPKTA